MSGSDQSVQLAVLDQQLRHDKEQRMFERADALTAGGTKGLAVLNSGASLAILAFFGSLAEKAAKQLACFKPFGLWALALFLIGAFLASISFIPHYQEVVFAHHGDRPRATTARLWLGGLIILSALCFAVGAIVAAVGISAAF